jgi:hypothetical protein
MGLPEQVLDLDQASGRARVPLDDFEDAGDARLLGADARHRGLAFEVRGLVAWDLSRLVFAAEEASLPWPDLYRLREEMRATVENYWNERRRLLRRLADAGDYQDEVALRRHLLRVDELTAVLDRLSGGIYGATAPKETRWTDG